MKNKKIKLLSDSQNHLWLELQQHKSNIYLDASLKDIELLGANWHDHISIINGKYGKYAILEGMKVHSQILGSCHESKPESSYVFEFGKYQGKPIELVYSGSNQINSTILSLYIESRVSSFDASVANISTLPIDYTFTFDKNFLSVIPNSIYNACKPTKPLDIKNELFSLFRNYNKNLYHFNFENIENLSEEYYHNETEDIFPISGQPEYIMWCIKNLDTFVLNPELLTQLEGLPVFQFIGLKFTEFSNRNYYCFPHIESTYYSFPHSVVEQNKRKYNEV